MAWEEEHNPGLSERVVSIDSGGVWIQGEVYTITWYEWQWYYSVSNPPNPASRYYKYGLTPYYPSGSASSSNEYTQTKLVYNSTSDADAYISVSDESILKGLYFTTWDNPNLMNNGITFTAVRGADEGGIAPDQGTGFITTHYLAKYLWTGTFTVAGNATPGTYKLAYKGFKWTLLFDNSKEVTEEQDERYDIRVVSVNSVPYPKARPSGYDTVVDDGSVWDPIPGAWVDPWDLETAGGGRFHRQLIVVGHRKIYFGAL